MGNFFGNAQYMKYSLPEFTDVVSGTFYFEYGEITADSIGQIILEEEICDKSKTQIICRQ